MFKEIEDFINQKKYQEANTALKELLSKEDIDEKASSYANNILGDIHTRYDYKEKKKYTAEKAFLACINSEYPYPNSYCGYADLVEDKNVAINYLKQGLVKFSKNASIYASLLKHYASFEEKLFYIKEVEKLNILDFQLLAKILGILIANESWVYCDSFAKKILLTYELDDEEKLLFELILSYSFLYKDKKTYLKQVENILLNLIKVDVKNYLSYSHYMGLIWFYIKQNDRNNALYYFDKIPVNGLKDFDNNPWLFYINFEETYDIILNCLLTFLEDDKDRKLKIKALKSMYLSYREEMFHGFKETSKADVKILRDYLKKNEDEIIVAKKIVDLQIKFKMHYDAYDTYRKVCKKERDFINDYDLEYILDDIEIDDLQRICLNLSGELKDIYLGETFITNTLDKIIDKLFNLETPFLNKYQEICNLCQNLDDRDLKLSSSLFELAYSYSKVKNIEKSEKLYLLALKKSPDSTAILNNLGIIYENKENYIKSYEYFAKAKIKDPEDKIYINNLNRISKKVEAERNKELKDIVGKLNVKFLESIGYDEKIITSLDKVNNIELKELLLKDLKECVVCIATRQNKSATILAGSIVEAILMDNLLSRDIKKYQIRKDLKEIKNMGINELLYVSNEEKIIPETTYHLSHFIKDYRNSIHPSYSLRKKIHISDEDVMVTWSILKKIIENVLK